jgi:hypothetical protein
MLCIFGKTEPTTLQRKSHLCIPKKGIARPQSQPDFHIHVSVSDLFIPRISPHIFLQQNRQTNRRNICINRSQTHECGNWNWSRANPFLDIFFPNFRYCVFAVHVVSSQKDAHRVGRQREERGYDDACAAEAIFCCPTMNSHRPKS